MFSVVEFTSDHSVAVIPDAWKEQLDQVRRIDLCIFATEISLVYIFKLMLQLPH